MTSDMSQAKDTSGSPPDSVQWPPALAASLIRIPIFGSIPNARERSSIISASPGISITKKSLKSHFLQHTGQGL